MEIQGRLASVGQTKQFDSGFMVQELYIDATRFNPQTGEKYSNHIKLQNANEKLNLEELTIGDMVKFQVSIDGRFWANQEGEARHAQNINAYKMEVVKKNGELPEMDNSVVFPY